MRYQISHLTSYTYSETVQFSYNEAHLTPKNIPGQVCDHAHLDIEPGVNNLNERVDFFDNVTHYFSILEPHNELNITANSQVTVIPTCPLDLEVSESAWRTDLEDIVGSSDEATILARQFILDSPSVAANEELYRYASDSFLDNRTILEAVTDLTRRIYNDFAYAPQSTSIATPLNKVLEERRGVCQDFAHVAIGCIRSMGFPARYISGYLETSPPPGKEKLIGVDASHAWFSVYSPLRGWVDFDPTNDMSPYDRHITVGWGRDYTDVTPLKGVIYGGGRHKLVVSVNVTRL